ncbi:MAG: RNA methyltransferase [Lentisphaeria bacterium]|nr:RNA methyltransferase [Lentisphaeria bacterium]NQZ66699.1 RNA methyltransferase [Lentisphaeria bacterium]
MPKQRKSDKPNFYQEKNRIARLQNDLGFREKTGLFFVEGIRHFIQLVDNDFNFDLIIYSEKLTTAALARKLLRQQRRAGIPVLPVSPEQFRLISKAKHASGIAAIAKQRWAILPSKSTHCWVLVDRVRADGNLGTLIRSAEAFGADGFIFINKQTDPYCPSVLRASMGAVFNQQIIHATMPQLQAWLKAETIQVIGASPIGQSMLHNFRFSTKTLMLIGEERHGLSDRQKTICQELVQIPMIGQADSFNLGIAGSLFLYENMRQKME